MAEMATVKLRVGRTGLGTVVINGTDVSDMVQGVEFRSYVGESTKVTLHLTAAVDVEAEGEIGIAGPGPVQEVGG